MARHTGATVNRSKGGKGRMRVRRIEDREDVRAILDIHARAWRAAYGDFLPAEAIEGIIDPDLDPDHVDQRYSTFMEDNDRAFVAERDGEVVGYAYFRWGSETKPFVGAAEAGLKEIYVDPAHWGSGVGTALLERGLNRLPDSCTTLKLEALAENAVGASFYEARGFERADRSEVRIGDEDWPTIIWSRPL